jgi:diguanylate cyclase (GGDEF)-like protein/PAS domain S-box-containing protein
MTAQALPERERDGILSALLDRRTDAVLAAFAEDGAMVPVPDVPGLAGHRTLPVPAVRSTLLSLTRPADRMVVATTWERSLAQGVARASIRLADAPDDPVTLVFVDARHRFGLRLGVLVAGEIEDVERTTPVAVELTALTRPRTATMRKNMYAVITAVDERATQLLGWPPAEIVGERSLTFIHPDDHDRAIATWQDLLSTKGTNRVRSRHRTSEGEWLWLEVEHTYLDAEDPADVTIVAELSDISDEMAAHDAINKREKLFRRLTEALPVGLFQVQTDGGIVYRNQRLGLILGVVEAATLPEQLVTVEPADRPALDATFALALSEGLDQELEVGVVVGEDRRRCLMTLVALSGDEGVPGAIVTVADVTEAARLREELRIRATTDALTGCHNRAATMTFLEAALAEDDLPLAVVFVDLDEFKPVNDRYGHAAGDQVLEFAAARLTGLLRPGDIAGRIGGDEFLLVCRGMARRGDALLVADRLRDALRGRVAVDGGTVGLRASIGVAVSSPGLSADDLVAMADGAMYESKRTGTGTPVLTPQN